MLKNLFESGSLFLRGIITGALLVAAAVAAIAVSFFVVMSVFRLIGLLWREVFGFPWTL
jgi:hypothetical protein